MAHKSGCKIEPTGGGGCELTYFGSFGTAIPSQTLKIRSKDDLADIIGHLEDYYLNLCDVEDLGE